MLYGKWRPQGFDEVVGQEQIVATLRNALATDQVAHAYLFSGPRGTGKTTTARILARAVNCPNLRDGDPCNGCEPCLAILRGNALDLIEMDAASNRGIDDIRSLREKIAFAPSDLKRKVYLLDEVHMLTTGAFNALLKTLEEPPPHAFFILATTEFHEVPATIVSRCQRYDFRRVGIEAIEKRLGHIARNEGFEIPPEGMRALAIQSRGGLRDAITLLEQVVAQFGGQPSTEDCLSALGLVHDPRSEELATAIVEGDLAQALELGRAVAADGIEIGRFARTALDVLRDRMLDEARSNGGSREKIARLAAAISEISKADFRLDPANPVPLEVAVANCILGPSVMVAAAPHFAESSYPAAPGGQARQPQPQGPPQQRAAAELPANDGPETEDERFLINLRNACRLMNVQAGALLNGSCEVVSIGEGTFELGFYHQVHMTRIVNEFRALVEECAARVLGRPMRLQTSQVERKLQQRRPRGGHLAETARALGGIPVGRDG